MTVLRMVEPAGPWSATLRKLASFEKRVVKSEHDGLVARWQFGRELLDKRQEYRGRSVIPKDLMDEAMGQLNLGRSEVKYRVQFAEAFPTRDLMATAVADNPTWNQMKIHGLPKPKRSKNRVTKHPAAVKETLSYFRKAESKSLTEADWKQVDALYDALIRLYEEAGRD